MKQATTYNHQKKHLVNSKVGIFFVHNTFHQIFFRYRHHLSFLGSCKLNQVSLAFLIGNAFVPHSNIVFGPLVFEFYLQIVSACQILEYSFSFFWTVWQIFFSSFYTSMHWLFRAENSFITLHGCIFAHIPRWRGRWWLWCLQSRLRKFTLVFHFFSFPIFSYSDSPLFKVFFIFFRTKTYFLYSLFPFSVFLSFSLFLWWYLSQYFLFEALLFLTDLGLPILLQRN